MNLSQFATMFGARRANIMSRINGCLFADGYSAPCACICSCHEGRAQYWNQKTQPPRRVAADAHDNVYSAAPYISVCIEQRSMCLSFALASEIFLEKGSTVPLLGTQYTFLNMCLFVLPAIVFACACFFFPAPPPSKRKCLHLLYLRTTLPSADVSCWRPQLPGVGRSGQSSARFSAFCAHDNAGSVALENIFLF